MAVVEFVEDFSPRKLWLEAVFCGDACLPSAGEIFQGADLLWPFDGLPGMVLTNHPLRFSPFSLSLSKREQ